MAWVIICCAAAVSSFAPLEVKYLKAPHRKYNTTAAAAKENMAGTKLLVAPPNDLKFPKPNFSPIFTPIRMVSLLLPGIFPKQI